MSKTREITWRCKAGVVAGPIQKTFANAGDAVTHVGPFLGCTGCDAKGTARCEGAERTEMVEGLDGESRSIPPRPEPPQGSGSDVDHKEDAANYVVGGMRCGKTLVMENAKMTAALGKINDIRNSIVGTATVNWSEHIYPLVAALDEAGIKGMEYPEARKNVGTLFDRAAKAEKRVTDLESLLRKHRAYHAEHNGRVEIVREIDAVLGKATNGGDS